MSATTTITESNSADELPDIVQHGLNKALTIKNDVLDGVEWFIKWIRKYVTAFFNEHLSQLPIVNKWAARLSVTITELLFTLIGTFINFIRTIVCDGKTWAMAHQSALKCWDENESNGLLSQSYAYGKKMASYFLEIVKQCLEKAIHASGLEVNDEEKQEIANHLDDLLGKE